MSKSNKDITVLAAIRQNRSVEFIIQLADEKGVEQSDAYDILLAIVAYQHRVKLFNGCMGITTVFFLSFFGPTCVPPRTRPDPGNRQHIIRLLDYFFDIFQHPVATPIGKKSSLLTAMILSVLRHHSSQSSGPRKNEVALTTTEEIIDMLLNHGYRFSDDPDDPKKRPISDFLLYLPEHRWYQTNIGVCLSLIERMEEVPYTAEQIRQLKFLTPGDATSRIRQALSQQLDELQADNDASKQQICVP